MEGQIEDRVTLIQVCLIAALSSCPKEESPGVSEGV
jgi:hypothetical protein